MKCEHLGCTGICGIASSLANKLVFPSLAQCEYCTQKATPSQDINKVTVSLALAVKPCNRNEILARYQHLLVDTSLQAQQREHWRLIHTTQMNAESFKVWIDGIPNKCDCRKSVDSLLEINPPRFNDWWRWGWEFHNAVNRKLKKAEVVWEEAAKLWNWKQ
jgi:hypothetical protein